ncbi:MAG: N-acetyltransferase [Thermodesulfobacteriota bacterium]
MADTETKTGAMQIRKATIEDVKSVHRLLHAYSGEGDLIPRPLSRLYDHVRDFWVAADPESGRVAGCCALQFCWEDLGEIRSLAVDTDLRGRGTATGLVNTCIEEARSFEMSRLFCLTFKPGFFERFGFVRIDRADLPLKIWSDCMLCVRFPDCEGIAMMKTL